VRVVLVHGGLWEDMDAERFWVRPGVVAGLAGLRMPVEVVPSLGGPFHQRSTVDALLALVPGAVERPGCPESPRPDFPEHRDAFVAALAGGSPGR
jgi:hypothetical protein